MILSDVSYEIALLLIDTTKCFPPLFLEMQWGSIGWAVPASFGYALAMEPDRRLVSIIGDGAFQLTAQEVANMIRYKTNNLIILVNNHGYVI